MPDSIHPDLLKFAESISKEYISSVLLIDDQLFFSDTNNNESSIDASEFIDVFARNRVNVCPFLWTKMEQFETIVGLVNSNDVSILDWKIQLQEQYSAEALDSDVMDGGDRGINAKKLLQSIIEQESTAPHLIIIYTNEISEVQEYLSHLHESNKGSCLLENNHIWISSNNNFRITLFFKDGVNVHGDETKWVIHNSGEMASFIFLEFAKFHKGIIPLSLLHSLSILRHSTSKLLTVFNEKLDPAFVIHKALSPEPTDGDTLLVQAFLDAFSALFFYQNRENINFDKLAQAWLDEKESLFGEGEIKISLKLENNINRKLVIDHNERKKWIKKGYPLYLQDLITEEICAKGHISQDSICYATKEWIHEFDYHGNMFAKVNQIFASYDPNTMRIANENFAVLTHHKSIFSPGKDYVPVMMLGCVIQKMGKEDCFLCIQQPCDCLRITDERQFLFLPLSLSPEKKFDIIIQDPTTKEHKRMAVNRDKSYYLKTIAFGSQQEDHVVRAIKDEIGNYVFIDKNNERFVWCCDIKETFALKFLNDYVYRMTRIGVDQSEWLRRS